jgi:two-component system cell cycle response regulator DivK
VTLLVLIVDDSEQNAKVARDVLEAAGMSALTAATATDGLALARMHQPDLELMDLRLPDLDGVEAARRLRADAPTAHIPIVALSATGGEEAIDWVRGECFSGYIEKPFDVREFPAQVRRLACRASPPSGRRLPP